MNRDTCIGGLLAALRLQSAPPKAPTAILHARSSALNRAFATALASEAGAFINRASLAIDFDPISGASRWLEQGLLRAHRDLLFVRLRDDTVEITLRADQAERLLRITGYRQEFLALGSAMLDALTLANVR